MKPATKTRLATYPFWWDGLEDFAYPLDEHGVPQVDIGSQWGLRYHPVTIAQFGLHALQRHARHKTESSLDQAGAAVDWLRANLQEWRPGIWAWVFDFDMEFYRLPAPWISAMAQGQGISLLLRYHQYRPLPDVRRLTERAVQAFFHPVAEGGVVTAFPDGALVFEEFTSTPASCVLNGHMFALLGLHDYANYWQDKAVGDLFEVAVAGLARNLERYDTGYWSRYDLHPTARLASPMYMQVHIRLLDIFAQLTSEATFATVAARWRTYQRSWLCRSRWLLAKILEKIRQRRARRSDPGGAL